MLPNTNLDVEIVTQTKTGVLALPREAVLGADTARYVFTPQNGILVRRPVETGILSATRVEIRSGLEEGDEVVLSGEQPLREGMQVRNSGR